MKAIALGIVALAASGAAPEIGDPMSAMEEIVSAHSSSSLAAIEHTLELTGDITVNGTSGDYRLRFDRHGNFLRESGARLGTTECRHGRGGWRTDWTGMPGPLDLSNRERVEIDLWIATGLWPANPDLLAVVSGPEPDGDGGLVLDVRVAGGTQEARVVLDAETRRPVSVTQVGVQGESVLRLEGTVERDGMLFPARMVRTVGGFREAEVTIRDVRAAAAADPSTPLAERPNAPDDVRFDDSPSDVPLRFAPTGHALVQPSINGEPTDWFIFDTGAGQSAVSTATAAALSLPAIGETVITSMFGVAQTPVYGADRFRLGAAELTRPVFASLDTSPLEPYFGEPVAGVVGYDLLSRSVVEIDLADGCLRIHRPGAFELTDGRWTELQLQDNHPIVPGTLDGHSGLFRLDVGAANALLVHGPAVKELDLLAGKETQEVDLGSEKGRLGMSDALTLGGETFENVETVFTEGDAGLFADSHTIGNIGVPVLRRFRMVLDYRNERIALIPKPE